MSMLTSRDQYIDSWAERGQSWVLGFLINGLSSSLTSLLLMVFSNSPMLEVQSSMERLVVPTMKLRVSPLRIDMKLDGRRPTIMTMRITKQSELQQTRMVSLPSSILLMM